MAQATVDQRILPTTGALGPVVAETQANLDALFSQNAGPAAPAVPVKGMPWLDTTSPTAHLAKIYDGTQWVTIATLNPSDHSYVQALSAGGTGGKTAAEARANLGLSGHTGFGRADMAGGGVWIYDMPSDISRFQFWILGAAVASGVATLSVRCAAAGQPAEAGASDYYVQKDINNAGVGQDTQESADAFSLMGVSTAPVATTVGEGYVGRDDAPWTLFTRFRYTQPGNVSGDLKGLRTANGAKRRLILRATSAGAPVALSAGLLVLEVAP